MSAIDEYIAYVTSVRRYSPRTAQIYSEVLGDFAAFASGDIVESLTPQIIRSYEVHLLDAPSAFAVPETLSVSFARFIRPEQAFASLTELKEQIARDVAAAHEKL